MSGSAGRAATAAGVPGDALPQERRARVGCRIPVTTRPARDAEDGGAPLLEIIVQDAPPGAVIEVNTAGMQVLVERMLQEVDRHHVTVVLRPPRGRVPAQGA